MRTIAIINQKGGCGKTTTAINLSGIFARNGLRTLLVDMDPQSHCAAGLAIPEQRIEVDIADALTAPPERPADPAKLFWRVSRNLDLAPSRMRLAGLEAPRGGLADAPDRDRRLAALLAHHAGAYDVCCIDCSPSIGLLTYNALAAATDLLIPVETSFFSLQGATKQVNTIKSLEKRLGVSVPHWLVATIHDTTSALAKDLLEELQRRFAGRVCPVVIRRDPTLREAASFGQPVVEYAPTSDGATDYAALAEWLAQTWRTTSPTTPTTSAAVPQATSRPRTPTPLTPEPTAVFTPQPAPIAAHAQGVPTPSHTHSPTISPAPTPVVTASATLSPPVSTQPVALQADPLTAAQPTNPITPARIREIAELARRIQLKTPAPAAAAALPSSSTIPATPVTTRPDFAADALPSPHADRPDDAPVIVRGPSFARPSAVAPAPLHPAPAPHTLETKPTSVLRLVEDVRRAVAPPDSVRVLFGARETNQGVLFVQPLSAGREVSIAGDFNGWSLAAGRMRRNDDLGVFELCVPVPPGRHHYRVVADGRWSADPYNPSSEPNPFGEPNSVLVVHAAPASPLELLARSR